MTENSGTVVAVMDSLGIVEVSGDEIKSLCQELLRNNPQTVEDYRGGKTKAIGALIGQAERATPNLTPDQVPEMPVSLLASPDF